MKPSKCYEMDESGCNDVVLNVDWTPEGQVFPCYFWRGDGCRYKVEKILSHVQLKTLKTGGEGMRYKVKARAVNESDDDSPYPEPYTFETYLILENSDGLFEPPVVDERYENPHKAYVHVNLDWYPDDTKEPRYFQRADESRYIVERLHGHRRIASLIAGGIGIRYKVTVRREDDTEGEDIHTIGLYLEFMRWFVELV